MSKNALNSNLIHVLFCHVGSKCGPVVILADPMLEEVYSSKFYGMHLIESWHEMVWPHYLNICSKLPSCIFAWGNCPNTALLRCWRWRITGWFTHTKNVQITILWERNDCKRKAVFDCCKTKEQSIIKVEGQLSRKWNC